MIFGTGIGNPIRKPILNMKKKILLPFAFLFVSFVMQAQPVPVAHLTIFSEDGDKFFLILNGEKQNTVAQTNLRVEDLTQDYYNAKVIFEDQSLGEISKNFLGLTDANGIKMDVTYKIKKNKNNGKMTLNYFSAVPVQQGYVAPSNVYVMHYGQPAPAPATTVVTTAPAGTVTHTTTTTTTTGGVTEGVNMNVGGINVGVSITDPLVTGSTTTTTRTTTTSSTTSSGNVIVEQTPAPTPVPVGCVNAYPMNSGNFSNALNTIKNQSFEEGKLKTAKQVAGGNCLNTAQIVQICKLFGFEESKLDFAKFAYDHCTEPNNYFNVNNVFSFSSSSDDLNDYVQSRR